MRTCNPFNILLFMSMARGLHEVGTKRHANHAVVLTWGTNFYLRTRETPQKENKCKLRLVHQCN